MRYARTRAASLVLVAATALALLAAAALPSASASTLHAPRLASVPLHRSTPRTASRQSLAGTSLDDDEDGLTEADRGEGPEKGKGSSASSASASASTNAKQYVGDDVDITNPPYNKAWPSPATVAFASRGGAVGSLSLASSLPPEYDATVGGRGVSPRAASGRQSVFAAARHKREADAAARRGAGAEPEDIMAAETERPRPRKQTILTAGYRLAEPNAYGAKPDDVPLVAPLAVGDPGAKPATAVEASRFVTTKGAAPFSLAFAGAAAVDQPTRRFRPPDQSLCVGAGVAFVGNNLVMRTFDAASGVPIQGPIATPDFLGLDGNFSDPVCIFDEPDTKRFFFSIFRFAEGSPGKYSNFIVAVSKTSNPADGFHGPYVFRNDGLDKDAKPLPGLEDCAGGGPRKDGKGVVAPGCLGDYPAVGLDGHALVATFNLFVTEPSEKYAGVLGMAVSKRDLLAGAVSEPRYVTYSNWNAELAYTVQPTQTQAGTKHDAGRGGTVYLASTGPVTQNEPNVPTLAVWALTNTSLLAAPDFPKPGVPSLSRVALVETPAYRDPGAFKAERLAMAQPDPGVALDTGDARTLQHVLSGGVTWVAAQTVMHVGDAGSPLVVGVVYWALLPEWTTKNGTDTFAPRLVATGYAGLDGGRSLARPAITATRDGTAWIAAFATGPGTAPSPLFVEVDIERGPVKGHLPALAPTPLLPSVPDKKWRGANGKGTLRAGDYSAACLDESGAPWLATAWAGGVPSAACVAKFTVDKCPSWSSFVAKASVPSAAGRPLASARVGGGAATPRGAAGPAVPGARSGEWAAKAAAAREAEARAAAAPAPGPAAWAGWGYDPDDEWEGAVGPAEAPAAV